MFPIESIVALWIACFDDGYVTKIRRIPPVTHMSYVCHPTDRQRTQLCNKLALDGLPKRPADRIIFDPMVVIDIKNKWGN